MGQGKDDRKSHTVISYVKSYVRITTCFIVVVLGAPIEFLAGGLLVAEILGVIEEW